MARQHKDIDKDMMFQKIMPVLADNPFANIARPAAQEQPAVQSQEIAALRSRLSPTLAPAEQTMPKNAAELVVCDLMDSVIRKFNSCPCKHCRQAIAIQALNQLPAYYVPHEEEQLAKAKEQVDQKAVYNVLIKAVLNVRAHPAHNENF